MLPCDDDRLPRSKRLPGDWRVFLLLVWMLAVVTAYTVSIAHSRWAQVSKLFGRFSPARMASAARAIPDPQAAPHIIETPVARASSSD
jgi:hypothetical protein